MSISNNPSGNSESLKFTNWSKSVAVLHHLADNGLTMHSGPKLIPVALKFHTAVQNVRAAATRHNDLLQIVVNLRKEIEDLKLEMNCDKIAKSQAKENQLPTYEQWQQADLASLEKMRKLGLMPSDLLSLEADGMSVADYNDCVKTLDNLQSKENLIKLS